MNAAAWTIADVSPIALLPSAFLMAQATGIDPGILSIVGNGVTVVVLAWYVIYDVRVRTPNMVAAFAAEQSAIRAAFAKEQHEMREAHKTTISDLRAAFIAEQTSLRQLFVSEQAASRMQYGNETGELRQMLFETLRSMRTAVHDVKDTVQPLLNKQSIVELEARPARS